MSELGLLQLLLLVAMVAVWLVAGANDLHLLGYGVHFSNYASLHGNVLGWIMVGAIAILADREAPAREHRVYVGAMLVCFVSFVLLALGIDRLRALEPVGVVGLTRALPLAQLTFLRSVRTRHRAAFALGCVSFAGLVGTMVLAWCNELAVPVLFQSHPSPARGTAWSTLGSPRQGSGCHGTSIPRRKALVGRHARGAGLLPAPLHETPRAR